MQSRGFEQFRRRLLERLDVGGDLRGYAAFPTTLYVFDFDACAPGKITLAQAVFAHETQCFARESLQQLWCVGWRCDWNRRHDWALGGIADPCDGGTDRDHRLRLLVE